MAVLIEVPAPEPVVLMPGPVTAPTGPGEANDHFTDAVVITKALGAYVSPYVDFTNFGTDLGAPDPLPYSGWWTYTPAESGTINVSLSNNEGGGFTVIAYSGGPEIGQLTFVWTPIQGDGSRNIPVTAGQPVWICLTWYADPAELTGTAITVQGPPSADYTPPPAPVNDDYANAVPIEIGVTGGFTSEAYLNTSAGDEVDEPYSGWAMYRSVWWSYRPAANGVLTIDSAQSSSPNVIVGIYRDIDGTPGGAQFITSSPANGGWSIGVTAGTTYAVKLGAQYNVGGVTYVLHATGPVTAVTGPVNVAGQITAGHDLTGVLAVDQALAGVLTGDSDLSGSLIADGASAVEVGAVLTGEHDLTGTLVQRNDLLGVVVQPQDLTGTLTFAPVSLLAPPALGYGFAEPATLIQATLTLNTPAEGLLVPSKRPRFTVDVVTDEPNVTLEVQISTGSGFDDPILLTAPVHRGLIVNRVGVQMGAELPALAGGTTYYWRARVTNGNDATDWSTARTFTVSLLDGDAVAAGGWTVATTTVPRPHLWFTNPGSAKPGEPVYLFGTAVTGTVHLSIADTLTDVLSVEQIPADDTALTEEREITAEHISPAHTRVRFTVPDVPGPGGILYADVS